jgi:hypothetical protein
MYPALACADGAESSGDWVHGEDLRQGRLVLGRSRLHDCQTATQVIETVDGPITMEAVWSAKRNQCCMVSKRNPREPEYSLNVPRYGMGKPLRSWPIPGT